MKLFSFRRKHNFDKTGGIVNKLNFVRGAGKLIFAWVDAGTGFDGQNLSGI